MRTLCMRLTTTSRLWLTSCRMKAGFCFLRRRLHKQQQQNQATHGQQMHGERKLVVMTMMVGAAASPVMFVAFASNGIGGRKGGRKGGSEGGGRGGGGESAVPSTICLHAMVIPRLANAASAAAGQPAGSVPFPGGSVIVITTDVFALVVGTHVIVSDTSVSFDVEVLFSLHVISKTACAERRTRVLRSIF